MADVPFIGSKISLISKCDIRYEGILYNVDAKESTISLSKVKSYGTETRGDPSCYVAPKNDIYDVIIFRASDVKDLRVDAPVPPGLQDPAIISAHQSYPSTSSFNNEERKTNLSSEARRTDGPGADNRRSDGPGIDGRRSGNTRGVDHRRDDNRVIDSRRGDGHNNEIQRGDGRRPNNRRDDNRILDSRRDDARIPDSRRDDGRSNENRRDDGRVNESRRDDNRREDNRRDDGRIESRRGDGRMSYGRRGDGRRGDSRMNDGRRGDGQYVRSYRGGHPHGRRARSGDRTGAPRKPRKDNQLKFESEYDFDKANKLFLKLDSQFKNMKLKDDKEDSAGEGANKVKSSAGQSEIGSGYDSEDQNRDSDSKDGFGGSVSGEFYDKSKSFFDNISCEASARSQGKVNKTDWRKERQMNAETFGVSANYRRGGYRGRPYGANGYHRK